MKFACLFAVKNIKCTRTFYEELFNLKVIDDFGRNIVFDCGLAFQQDFDWLTGISKNDMKNKENNCEIVFEEEHFDNFVCRLKLRNDITLLHDVVEHSWGQRVIRFYDVDNHLIEVGEQMKAVVERFQRDGLSLEETATKMEVTVDDVQRMLRG